MLHELKPARGSVGRSKRVGRGIGSGKGKTCGRGTKGQSSRNNIHPAFEGGQTPIHRRLPVKKGFKQRNKREYAIVNVKVLEEYFAAGSEIGPDSLASKGLIGELGDGLKILGFGDLSKNFKVSAHAFSRSAEDKIKRAGGEVIRL